MLNGDKSGWQAWTASLRTLARSPAYVIALAAIAGLWAWAGYEWLWLPESSVWLLALALGWLLALAAIALALLAGSVASVSSTVSRTDARLSMRKILRFETRRLGHAALVVLAGVVLGVLLDEVFGWVNARALDAASFLTFHSQHPVSHVVMSEIFWVIEALIWIAFAGFLFVWLLVLSNRQKAKTLATAERRRTRSHRLIVFITGVISTVVFGGLAWRLATWHPLVKAGGWDYAQLALRNGAALLLLTLGWLFWTLALAHLTLVRVTEPPALTPPS